MTWLALLTAGGVQGAEDSGLSRQPRRLNNRNRISARCAPCVLRFTRRQPTSLPIR